MPRAAVARKPRRPSKKQRAALREGARRELACRFLADFVRQAWPILEPSKPLVWNWHLDLLCAELEAVSRGEVSELVICVPPGHMKSLLVSVFWPAWQWLHNPSERRLTLSNDDALSARDSRRTREVLRSDWYRALVAYRATATGTKPWDMAKDQDQKVNFENDARGFRQCLSIGGRVTGKRADVITVDDPHDAKDALIGSPEQVRRRMADVVTIYDEVLESRLTPGGEGARVVIMQRLHEADLAGVLLDRGVRAVVLPALYDPEHPHRHPDDPRTVEGEPLFPGLFPAEKIAQRRADNPRTHAAQDQQRPTPAEGDLFREAWFQRRYLGNPWDLGLTDLWLSVDATFKDSKGSDFVAIGVLGYKRPDFYVLDVLCQRMDYPATKQAIKMMRERWPAAVATVIEDKANGPALIADLRREIPGLIPFSPQDSKYARAQVSATYLEAGNVVLPERAPWVARFVAEHLAFPRGAHDDMVDMLSQALIWKVRRGLLFGAG